jgi:hypothetical protein
VRDREQRRENRVAEKDKNRVAEKLNRAAVLSLKRRRLASLRTGPVPDPTRPVPKPYRKYFFLAENGYAGGTHAAVPRQYPYPRGTRYGYGGVFAVPVLPRC